MAVFTLAPFAGPSLGPTVAGFMAVAGLSSPFFEIMMSLKHFPSV
jgi:hypothetical protein